MDIFYLENRVNFLKKGSQSRWVKLKSWKLVVIEQLVNFGRDDGMDVAGKFLVVSCSKWSRNVFDILLQQCFEKEKYTCQIHSLPFFPSTL